MDATREAAMGVKSNSWRDVHEKFKLLDNEQQGMGEDKRLCVVRDTNPRAGDWGPFGKLPEMGPWKVVKGPSLLFRKKFETLATQAGAKLGSPPRDFLLPLEPSVFWLDCMYEYLLGIVSPQLCEVEHGREIIKSVCEASAAYCARLETDTREAAGSTLKRDTGPTKERASFVLPILAEKGWSTLDWAKHSEVDFNTAASYLKGKTRTFNSSRKKLAESLGVEVQKLPR